MNRKLVHLFGLALVLVAAGFLASASAGDKDKTPVEGVWKHPEAGKEATLIFTGDKFVLKKGDDAYASGTFKVDATKKPSTMDLTIKDTGKQDKGAEKYVGKTSLAIYELEGDTLKWCANEPGKDERPTEFAEGKGLYLVFQREKKK